MAARGRDILDGGDGDDLLLGGEGNDSLYGAAGADDLSGGTGADVLVGDAGDDRLQGGEGADILSDGAGRDLVSGEAGDDVIILALDSAEDTVDGGAGAGHARPVGGHGRSGGGPEERDRVRSGARPRPDHLGRGDHRGIGRRPLRGGRPGSRAHRRRRRRRVRIRRSGRAARWHPHRADHGLLRRRLHRSGPLRPVQGGDRGRAPARGGAPGRKRCTDRDPVPVRSFRRPGPHGRLGRPRP
ncbi:protein of unknown function [Methylorubrum extorquens]|uniref:Hemolysin-type calcium-binding region n=1 Tax=Methylorubrum extorquens TaxID=408 RepID=A0A2N9AUB9_METEX|nr:protein of unknown function [Methylorubrum extorquens]